GAGLEHVHPDRGEARNQRGLDHVAGEPGVLADEHTMAMLAATKHQARRLSNPQRELRCDHAVGTAPDAVSAEKTSRHLVLLPPHGENRLRMPVSGPSYVKSGLKFLT